MKNFAKNCIQNRDMNYTIAVGIMILLFSILNGVFTHIEVVKHGSYLLKLFCFLVALAGSIGLVFASKETIQPRTSQHLIDAFGEETNIWLEAGTRFLFFLFTLDDPHETAHKERDKIEVGPINFTDTNGKKLTGYVTAIWVVGETDELRRNFKLMKEKEIEKDLKTYLERSFIRTFSTKEYDTEIKGKEDLHLVPSEVTKYGVNFIEVDPVVVSGNMDQDDYESRYEKRMLLKKSRYPAGHVFTHDELSQLHEEISTDLGRAKLVINKGSGQTLWRGDV